MQTFKATNQSNNTVNELIQVINGLVSEFHQNHPSVKAISLDSHFEKDLGLDSLARVELIARIEKKFRLALPEQTFSEAESARDLLRAIQGAETSRESLIDCFKSILYFLYWPKNYTISYSYQYSYKACP